MSSTITVDTADLLALLRDVREAAGKDDTLPLLSGVMLHTAAVDSRSRLVATATDRFIALQGSIAVEGNLAQRVFLTHPQMTQLAASLRPYAGRKTAKAQTSVSTTSETVLFEQVSLDDLATVSIGFTHQGRRDFPDVPKLMQRSLDVPASDEPYHVDGHRMVTMARIAARRSESLALQGRGPTKAVIVRIGPDLSGLLMPWRAGADAPSPLNVPIHSLPVLSEPQEAAA